MRPAILFSLALILTLSTGCKRPIEDSPDQPDQASSIAFGPGDSMPPDAPADIPNAPADAPSAQSPIPATPVAADSPAITTDDEADYFYDDLAPFGQWIQVADYGPCWQPANVDPDWCPYTLGNWAYTADYGWYWNSNEPFGWCTYHYGRWADLPGQGWCWVPGRTWGPAWVVWRNGGGLCGWAPLPPVGRGQTIAAEIADIHPWAFRFCDERYLADPDVRNHFEPITRNVTLIDQTRNITRFDRSANHIVNRGVDVAEVEKVRGAPVDRFTVRDATDPHGVTTSGHEVAAFRPQIPARQSPLAKPEPRFEPAPAARGVQAADNGSAERWNTYYQSQQTEMQQRHQQELQKPPAGEKPEQTQARQQREQQAFEQQRQYHTPTPQQQPPARVVRRAAPQPQGDRGR
jgi:hypothetical protein